MGKRRCCSQSGNHTQALSWGKAVVWLGCEQNHFFFVEYYFYFKHAKTIMAIQTRVFNRHSLENKWSNLATWRNQPYGCIVANDQIQAREQKLVLCKSLNLPSGAQQLFGNSRTFLMSLMVLFVNVRGFRWDFTMKCANTWTICISQGPEFSK